MTLVISGIKYIGGGQAGGRWGGRWGWVGSRRQATPSTRRQTAVLCPQQGTETATVNLVGRDSSLTPQAALLVPISGPIDPVVNRRGFTGSAKDRM